MQISMGLIAKNSVFIMIVRAATAFVGFGSSTLIARSIGPEAMGIYGVFLAAVAILSLPAIQGWQTILTREFGGKLARKDYKSALGVFYFSMVGIVTMSIIGGILASVPQVRNVLTADTPTLPLIIALTLTGLTAAGSGILIALGRPVIAQAGGLIQRTSMGIILATLVYVGCLNLTIVTWVYVMGLSITLIVLSIYIINVWPSNVLKQAEYRKMPLKTLSLQFVSGSLAVLSARVIVLFASAWALPAELGQLVVALQISTLITFSTSSINQAALGPLISLCAIGRLKDVQYLITRASSVSTCISIIIYAGFAIAGQQLCNIMFGEGFEKVYYFTLILGLGAVLAGVFGGAINTLSSLGHFKALLYLSAGRLLITAISSVILIQVWGAPGAAWAQVISGGAYTLASAALCWKLSTIKVFPSWEHIIKLLPRKRGNDGPAN